MEIRDREKLQRNYAKLLDVIYSSISPHLISTFVLTLEMHDEIDSKPTERKKMEKLLSILPSRGGNAMKELINALKPSYRWIAVELERDFDPRAFNNFQNNNNNMHNLPDTSIGSHLRSISRILQKHPRASTHWTFLANSMNLLPTTIMDIKREMSFSGGHEYAIFSVLEGWVTKSGSSQATFSKLVALLEGEGMNQCAEEVMEYWESITPSRCHENQRPSSTQHHQIHRRSSTTGSHGITSV